MHVRIYYVFCIKDDIYKETKNDPYGLYKILEKIYFMNNEEAKLGKKLIERLIIKIDKDNLNTLIKSIHKNNLNYMCFNYTHVINDFFTNESSKMSIHNTFIKIKSSSCFPEFFKDIKNYKNVFICDFINLDYFYLKESFKSACAI